MATEELVDNNQVLIITISKKEAGELIVYLAASLSNYNIPNNSSNTAPTIHIVDKGFLTKRIIFCLDKLAT